MKLSAPPPVFVRDAVCNDGFAPPCVAEKVSAEGKTLSTGGGGVVGETRKVTVTVAGEPCAPGAVIVR